MKIKGINLEGKITHIYTSFDSTPSQEGRSYKYKVGGRYWNEESVESAPYPADKSYGLVSVAQSDEGFWLVLLNRRATALYSTTRERAQQLAEQYARENAYELEKSERHVEGKGGHVSNHPLTCPLCQRLGKSETPIDDSTVMVMTVEDMKTASIVDRIKARQAPRENTTVKRQKTTAKSFKDVWAEKNTSRTLTKSQEMEKAFSDAPDAVRDAIASYIVGGMMGGVDGDTLLREIQSKFAGQIRQYDLDVVKLMQLLRSPFNKSWGSPTANKNSASVFVRSMLRELKSGSEMGKAATSDLYKIATDVAQEWGCTKAEATQLVMAEARKMGVSH